MMARRLTPEWLDELPPEDRRAMVSRADLARVNAWMLQAVWARRALRRARRVPARWMDIGAGDGRFVLRIARGMGAAWHGATIILVDRQDIVSEATRAGFARLGMRLETRIGDVTDVLRSGERVDLLTANLFLHHFEDAALRDLLAAVAVMADGVMCVEPRRATPALWGTRLLWLIGCNDVTRHDARVSVEAGFTGQEISALWPGGTGWGRPFEARAGMFSHVFSVWREIPA